MSDAECHRCGGEADRAVTWPFNGVTELYCAACMAEYHAGADEIDAHEERLAREGLPAFAVPRPTERRLPRDEKVRTNTV